MSDRDFFRTLLSLAAQTVHYRQSDYNYDAVPSQQNFSARHRPDAYSQNYFFPNFAPPARHYLPSRQERLMQSRQRIRPAVRRSQCSRQSHYSQRYYGQEPANYAFNMTMASQNVPREFRFGSQTSSQVEQVDAFDQPYVDDEDFTKDTIHDWMSKPQCVQSSTKHVSGGKGHALAMELCQSSHKGITVKWKLNTVKSEMPKMPVSNTYYMVSVEKLTPKDELRQSWMSRKTPEVTSWKQDGKQSAFKLPMDLESGIMYRHTLKAFGMSPANNAIASTTCEKLNVNTVEDLLVLLSKAHKYLEQRQMYEVKYLYRNKPRQYWDDIQANDNGIMKKYRKDFNGDPGNPINGQIDGLFFGCKIDPVTGNPHMQSPFGEMRLHIPVGLLLKKFCRFYFADFYCLNGHPVHYLTVVITVQDSETDVFCSKHLPVINPTKPNRFFFCDVVRNKVYTAQEVWVELFYTEDIDIRPFWKSLVCVPTLGRGKSTKLGILKSPDCRDCCLFPTEPQWLLHDEKGSSRPHARGKYVKRTKAIAKVTPTPREGASKVVEENEEDNQGARTAEAAQTAEEVDVDLDQTKDYSNFIRDLSKTVTQGEFCQTLTEQKEDDNDSTNMSADHKEEAKLIAKTRDDVNKSESDQLDETLLLTDVIDDPIECRTDDHKGASRIAMEYSYILDGERFDDMDSTVLETPLRDDNRKRPRVSTSTPRIQAAKRLRPDEGIDFVAGKLEVDPDDTETRNTLDVDCSAMNDDELEALMAEISADATEEELSQGKLLLDV